MLFNTLNLIYLNVTMPNLTRKIFTQISLAGLYCEPGFPRQGVVALLVGPRVGPINSTSANFVLVWHSQRRHAVSTGRVRESRATS